jgi:predicted nucleotidyltransferase
MVKKISENIGKQLLKEPGVVAAYVFGSQAGGYQTKASDVDLAVAVEDRRRVSVEEVYDLIKDVGLDGQIDLCVIDKSSSPLLAYEVVSKGKRVYERDEQAVNKFEARVLHIYYDTRHLRSIYSSYLYKDYS